MPNSLSPHNSILPHTKPARHTKPAKVGEKISKRIGSKWAHGKYTGSFKATWHPENPNISGLPGVLDGPWRYVTETGSGGLGDPWTHLVPTDYGYNGTIGNHWPVGYFRVPHNLGVIPVDYMISTSVEPITFRLMGAQGPFLVDPDFSPDIPKSIGRMPNRLIRLQSSLTPKWDYDREEYVDVDKNSFNFQVDLTPSTVMFMEGSYTNLFDNFPSKYMELPVNTYFPIRFNPSDPPSNQTIYNSSLAMNVGDMPLEFSYTVEWVAQLDGGGVLPE